MSAQFNLRGELLANEHERKVARHIAGEVAALFDLRQDGSMAQTLNQLPAERGRFVPRNFKPRWQCSECGKPMSGEVGTPAQCSCGGWIESSRAKVDRNAVESGRAIIAGEMKLEAA